MILLKSWRGGGDLDGVWEGFRTIFEGSKHNMIVEILQTIVAEVSTFPKIFGNNSVLRQPRIENDGIFRV